MKGLILQMKIIIDVMGGDNAPDEILKGAFDAANEYGVELVLVGDETQIKRVASMCSFDLADHCVVHTDVVVNMDDDPMVVLHAKKESSLCCGLRMLASGEGDAFVSAANTGALFTAASLIVRKIPGIQRAAIASILPMTPPVLLLDSGANVSVTDGYLEQFAVMGSAYMKNVHAIESPRIGLLNNGTEESKGTQLQMDTYKRLRENRDINFVGNVEANNIPFDACDVLVADGFTGNIALKSIEGMGKMMLKTLKDCFYTNIRTKAAAVLINEEIQNIKKNFDPSEYGGAPLLGLRKPVIKAHGSSKAKAIKNAIRQARNCANLDVSEKISCEINKLAAQNRSKAEAAQSETAEVTK